MVKKKTWGNILQAPLLILNIVAVFAAFYAAYKHLISGYAAGVILTLFVVLYFVGVWLKKKSERDYF